MNKLPNPQCITVRRCVPLALLLGLTGCSGGGGSAPTPLNQAPAASNSCAYASGVNQSLNGNLSLSATDPEGQSLSFTVVTPPENGALSLNPLTGLFTYTPTPNTRGSDTFTFRACEVAPSTVCSNVATYKIVHTPRIMPLGDSITEGVIIGTGCTGPCPVLDERISYRKDLRDALVAAGYTVDFVGTQESGTTLISEDPQHEGHGGWSAINLVNGNSSPSPGTGTANTGKLSNWLIGKKDSELGTVPDPTNAGWPDVILLHIGTNDLSPDGDQSGLWTNVQAIRNEINNWSSANSWPVTVIYSRIDNSIPSTSEFTTFNTNVITSLIPAIWVNHEAALLDISGFYGDSIHPNASGYQAMANVWLYPLAGIGTTSGNYVGSGILQKCP